MMEQLQRPIGPLVLWQWGVVLIGGYIGYRFLTGRSGGSGSTSATSGNATAGITQGPQGEQGPVGRVDYSRLEALRKSLQGQINTANTVNAAQSKTNTQQNTLIRQLQATIDSQQQQIDKLAHQQAHLMPYNPYTPNATAVASAISMPPSTTQGTQVH